MSSTTETAPGGARRDDQLVLAVGFALLSLIVALVAVGFSMRDDGGSTVEAASAGGGAATAAVSLTEFSIKPASVTVTVGGSIKATNDGSQTHNLAIKEHDSLITSDLTAGQSATLDVSTLPPGTYSMYCAIPGHEAAGMTGTVEVVEGTGGEVAGGGGDQPVSSGELTAEEMDRSAHARAAEFPQKTEGEGGKLLEPTEVANGVKVFDLTVDVIQWEIEKGKKVEAWAYNGQVPGPTMKLQSGDRVRFRVKNNLKESTTVHWHGIDVPNEMDGVPDVTQEQIKPGTTFTYEFTVEGPAVGMYHAHSNSQKQVPMGLSAGMIVADLPLPAGTKVTQEIPFIVNDSGKLGFTINGKAFPATKPIVAKVGETILAHYYNEGLQVHPMHLHGPRQLIIAKDGNPLPQPYYADTVLVGPGERYSVLVTPNRPGTWVWHCHILTHAEAPEGFIGMTTALVVT